jgi:hypothetical protein
VLTTEKAIGYRSSRIPTQRCINIVVGRGVLMTRGRDDGVEMTLKVAEAVLIDEHHSCPQPSARIGGMLDGTRSAN